MRIGLVLGAGGILGSAWQTGLLAALAQRLDRPLSELDLVLGTSAGSVLGAALRCGMGIEDLLAYQRGGLPGPHEPADRPELPDMATIDREAGNGLPRLPLPWIGSPRMLITAAGQPSRINPVIVASALLPVGRSRMGSLITMVAALQGRIGVTPDRWVPGAPLWVVAVNYDSGRRVVFGRAGGPPASVGDAVLASCAIPGWFIPQVIEGHRYVDGGIASSTSVGLLARPGAPRLDEVYVLAPMASHDYDRPWDPAIRMERGMRRLLTRWLDAEVRAVRATGTRVVVLTPGPAELRAMGGNLMHPRRRAAVLEAALAHAPALLDRAGAEGRAAAA
ncbi:MAG TPA: patatin-like phospholipase family protein [Pseudonocardia sp.]|nr:patatin-like phospholipase family protein [Pseudonocardia sp.]